MQVIWWGVISSGKDPPRAHARLLTEKGLAERPLCGIGYQWSEPQPERGQCRLCWDIEKTLRRREGWRR